MRKQNLASVVDSVLRQQDILVKTLSETLSGIKGISGATILGDGQVVLVLDVKQFTHKVQTKPKPQTFCFCASFFEALK